MPGTTRSCYFTSCRAGGSTPGRLLPWEVCMQSDKNPPRGPVAQKTRTPELARTEPKIELLRELVAHLRQNRTLLREEWVARIAEAQLLTDRKSTPLNSSHVT